jgi:hypothetical protein
MDAEPSIAAWAVLVTLYATFLIHGWLLSRSWKREGHERDQEQRPSMVPRWMMPLTGLAALVPAVIVAILGAPWQTIVW